MCMWFNLETFQVVLNIYLLYAYLCWHTYLDAEKALLKNGSIIWIQYIYVGTHHYLY